MWRAGQGSVFQVHRSLHLETRPAQRAFKRMRLGLSRSHPPLNRAGSGSSGRRPGHLGHLSRVPLAATALRQWSPEQNYRVRVSSKWEVVVSTSIDKGVFPIDAYFPGMGRSFRLAMYALAFVCDSLTSSGNGPSSTVTRCGPTTTPGRFPNSSANFPWSSVMAVEIQLPGRSGVIGTNLTSTRARGWPSIVTTPPAVTTCGSGFRAHPIKAMHSEMALPTTRT